MENITVPSISGVETAKEETRKIMAYGSLFGFLGLLASIVLFAWIVMRIPIDDVLKILTTTAGVLSGVVGAVVGFYFRSEDTDV